MKSATTPFVALHDFQTIFEAIPTPFVILKPDAPFFTILAANDAYVNATMAERNSMIGRSIFEVFPENPSDAGAKGVHNISSSLMQVIDTGKSHKMPVQQYDLRIPGTNSYEKRHWLLQSTPVYDDTGAIAYIIHSTTDVTRQFEMEQRELRSRSKEEESLRKIDEIKHAQNASEEFARYLEEVIDNSQTGIFLFTPIFDKGEVVDFRFRMANSALAAYVGQDKNNVTGAMGSRWFPAYKNNGLFERYRSTYLSGKPERFEFHYDDDGIDVWLDILSTKLEDEVLVTFTDHTNMKLLQQQLENSISELKRSNANLEQFAYVASHDLQEPLRKIKAFGDMLMNRFGAELGEQGLDLITRMQSAAERMRALMEDLLTYSRISSRQPDFQPVDLNSVLAEVQNDLETSIKDKQAKIRMGRLHPVDGDTTQLQQLFMNLLSNSLKFSKPDAQPVIEISSKLLTAQETGIASKLKNPRQHYQLIEVQDNGIGFEQEYADRIFQIFQRLHGRTDFPGTGVGLSIVKKVVENHNGYINAKGAPGEGSVFSIYLPCKRS